MSGDENAAGARIARARRRRGLSQSVLAGLVGRSESWLSQVERGKRGVDSYAVLTRMAEVLRVEVEELTGPGGGVLWCTSRVSGVDSAGQRPVVLGWERRAGTSDCRLRRDKPAPCGSVAGRAQIRHELRRRPGIRLH